MDFLYGLEKISEQIKKYCEQYTKNENIEIRRRLGIIPSILLYGPPGTGKTSLTYNIYKELKQDHNIDIYKFDFENIVSSNLGETSKNIVSFFSEVKKEIDDNESFAFIILDEIDAISLSRHKVTENDGIRRALLTLNKEIDNLLRTEYYGKVIIIGISNVYEHIDTSLIRRFFLKISSNVSLQKDEFVEYISKLLDIGNMKVPLDMKQIEKLYQVYCKKKMTLGEVKSLIAHYYINNITDLNIEFCIEDLNNYFSIYEQFEYQKEVFK